MIRAALLLVLTLAAIVPMKAVCLPFNQDMVGKQLVTGTVMRAPAEQAVPSGVANRQLASRESAKGMLNPYSEAGTSKRDLEHSVMRGKRLYKQQCMVCHGSYSAGKHTPSEVNLLPWGIVSFNLLLTSPKYAPIKTDDYVFGYIHSGAMVVMPAYGWKLAHSEIWDLVNYIRHFQAETEQ